MRKEDGKKLAFGYFVAFIAAILLIMVTYQGWITGHISYSTDAAAEQEAITTQQSSPGAPENGDEEEQEEETEEGIDIDESMEKLIERIKEAQEFRISKYCECPLDFAPVCGMDGNVYSNACWARCAGVKVAYSIPLNHLNAIDPTKCDPDKDPFAVPGVPGFGSDEGILGEDVDPSIEIEISKGEVTINQETFTGVEQKVTTNVGKNKVSVETTRERAVIKDDDFEVYVQKVIVKDNALKVGTSEVKVSPSEAMRNIRGIVLDAELKEENGEAIYIVKMQERRRLIWIFPINVESTYKISAENGVVIEKTRPLFWFLTSGITGKAYWDPDAPIGPDSATLPEEGTMRMPEAGEMEEITR